MNTSTKKYAVYSRKSKFTGKGDSIENQAEMCRQYILSHYPGTKREDILVYEDEGYSGSHLNRPQFQQMMHTAKTGGLQGIICYRLDRISRNIGDFASLIEQLGNLDIAFVSIREQFDTSSPLGRAMMYIASVFSQLERETTAERIRDNMHELAKTGRWLGGITPTGYRSTQLTNSVTLDGKPRSAFKLEPVPEECLIVKMIYAKFLVYNSLTKVETDLINFNVRTKNGKNYSRFTIRSILQNPVYMTADQDAWEYFQAKGVEIHSPKEDFDAAYGIMAYNKTNQKPGRANETREMQEWIIAVGRHVPTISSADWIRAQCLLEQNKSKSFRKPKSHTALLSGLLVCGHCGSFMRPKLSQRVNEKGERKYSYLCETKERSRMQKCQATNANGNLLDDALCREIALLEENSSRFLHELRKAKRQMAEYQDPCSEQLSGLYKAVAQRETEINELISVLAKGTGQASQDYITKQIDQLYEVNMLTKQQILDCEQTKKQVYSRDEIYSLKEQLVTFQTCFVSMNLEQKRMALRTIVRQVVWDGKNVHVYLSGSEKTPKLHLLQTEPSCEDSK